MRPCMCVCVCGAQVFLVLIAFVAVPWMLVPKPLILKKRHEASQNVSSWLNSTHPARRRWWHCAL
jgi:hypothetical protein